MTERTVLLTCADGAAIVTLNRPRQLNALNADMAVALRDAFARIAEDRAVRAVTIRGEGRAFCSGGDVSAFAGGDPRHAIEAIIDPFHDAMRRLESLSVPTLAVVQGAAAGAGLSLAMACDLCVAAQDARFTLAYSKIGASPDGSSTWRLIRHLGHRKAMEIALLADTFDAAEAQRLGLVNRCVASASLDEEAEALLRRLVEGPTDAFARTKRLIRAAGGNDLSTQLDLEREAFLAGCRGAEFQEGVAAFLKKRPAQFRETGL
jgi:2-(1,2-epoxy-1,2-dihydrophenyl)acetyl-CoA isomerase